MVVSQNQGRSVALHYEQGMWKECVGNNDKIRCLACIPSKRVKTHKILTFLIIIHFNDHQSNFLHVKGIVS
jgi:hypothetical protein